MESKKRGQFKAFNFDLDTNKLKVHYPKSHYTEAYHDIKRFMEKNGFDHRQGSGYRSKKVLTEYEVMDVIDKLKTEHPWITDCVNKFDVTNIGKTYDLTDVLTVKQIDFDKSQKEHSMFVPEEERDFDNKGFSLESWSEKADLRKDSIATPDFGEAELGIEKGGDLLDR